MADRDASELIERFLADEDAALAAGVSGRFWPSNHHRIRPLVNKVPTLLAPDRRAGFYLHFMRRMGDVPAVPEKELPFLIEGYRYLLPLIDQPNKAQSARRLPMLFAFGFDESGALASGETHTAKDLKARLKLLTQIGKYVNLPGQRAKKANFVPFAGEAERLLQTLRHLGYRHDRRYGDDQYDTANLTFWGMVLTILLDAEARAGLLEDMLDGDYDLPHRDRHLGILHKSVRAVFADLDPGEMRFRDLAGHLAAAEMARRNATETVALARSLNLPFDDDEDWEMAISLTEEGSGRSPLLAPNLVLVMRADPDSPWHVALTHSQRGRFSEWDGKITQNDPGMPGLGKGNLAGFPAWLRSMRERWGMAYDLGKADIRAGRKREAAKRLAEWLAEGAS